MGGEKLGELDPAVTLVLHLFAGLAWWAAGYGRDVAARGAEPDLVCRDAEFVKGQRGHRLLLGGHDALERRIASRPRAIGDTDHGGQLSGHGPATLVGLAFDGDLRARHLELAGVRDVRDAEMFRDHRADDTHSGV